MTENSFSISGSTSNCSFSAVGTSAGANAATPFGISPASCYTLSSTQTSSVAFYVIGSGGGKGATAAICTPQIQLQKADVFLNSTTKSLLLVSGQTPLTDANVGGVNLKSAPFNGDGFNG